MASIQKRGSRWFARYRDDTGREHAQRFDRKVDAQRWIDEATAALVTGQYVDPRAGRVTFREFAEAWRLAAPHGPTMRDKVQRTLELHVYPTFGDLPVSVVRPSAVQSWASGLPLAPASAKVALGYLSSVFRAAVRDRLVTANPCDGVSVPSTRRREVWIPDLAMVGAVREHLPAIPRCGGSGGWVRDPPGGGVRVGGRCGHLPGLPGGIGESAAHLPVAPPAVPR